MSDSEKSEEACAAGVGSLFEGFGGETRKRSAASPSGGSNSSISSKKKKLSGAQKRQRRKERDARAKEEKEDQRAKEDASDKDSDGAEWALVNSKKSKTCSFCKCTLKTPDPVKRTRPMRWCKPNRSGKLCYYCHRVHELKYGNLSRKEVQKKLKDSESAEVDKESDKFTAFRNKAIELLSEGASRLRVLSAWLPTLAKERVLKTKKRKNKRSRRGHLYTLAAFGKEFPNDDPRKKGEVFDRKDRNGKSQTWVKVYKHADGVESFSENSEEGVGHEHVVDDGNLVLDDNQMEEAFDNAVKASLQTEKIKGMLASDLTPTKPDTPASAPSKTTPAKPKKDASSSSSSDSGSEEAAPIAKALKSASTPDSKGKKKDKKDTPPVSKDLAKLVEAANKLHRKVEEFLNIFVKSSKYDTDLLDSLAKLLAELKAVLSNSKVLVKGGHGSLCKRLDDFATWLKDAVTYCKMYAVWHKAKMDGKQTTKKKGQKSPATALMESYDSLQNRWRPAWSKCAAVAVKLDTLLFEDKTAEVKELITTSSLTSALDCSKEAGGLWLEGSLIDITTDAFKSGSVEQCASKMMSYIEELRKKDIYTTTKTTAERLDLLEVLSNAEACSSCDLHRTCIRVEELKGKEDAFWLVVLGQALFKKLMTQVKATQEKFSVEDKILASFQTSADTLAKLVAQSAATDADHLQNMDLWTANANRLIADINNMAKQSREAFMRGKDALVTRAIQDSVSIMLNIDEKLLVPGWGMTVLDATCWQDASRVEGMRTLSGRHLCLANVCRDLQATAFPGATGAAIFKDLNQLRLPNIAKSVDFRISCLKLTCACSVIEIDTDTVQQIKDGQKDMKDAVDDMPALTTKVVSLCAAHTEVQTAVDRHLTGVEVDVLDNDNVQKLTGNMETAKLRIDAFAEHFLKLEKEPFEASLCHTKLPEDLKHKFMATGMTDDLLETLSKTETRPAEALRHLAHALGRRADGLTFQCQELVSRAQRHAAKIMLRHGQLVPMSELHINNAKIDTDLAISLQSLVANIKELSDVLGAWEETQDANRVLYLSMNSEALTFVEDQKDNLEKRIVKSLQLSKKTMEVKTPDWRDYVLKNEDKDKIIKNLCSEEALQSLSATYVACTALNADAATLVERFDLHTDVTEKELWTGAQQGADEIKLTLAVMHACNTYYVRAPRAKDAKAKAGLLRELRARIKNTSGVTLPAELFARINSI